MEADRVVRSTCPYCGVGCQVLLNVKDDKISQLGLEVVHRGQSSGEGRDREFIVQGELFGDCLPQCVIIIDDQYFLLVAHFAQYRI